MKQIFLVRGLPGSGKTTLAAQLTDVVLSADDFFTDDEGNYSFDATKLRDAHCWCRSEAKRAMENELSFTVANTFTQEWEMKSYLELAKEHGYMVHTIVVENRHGSKDIHNVPVETIGQMRERFEVVL